MDIFLQELAHGLSELLSYEGNVEEDFFSTFQVLFRANNFLLTMYFIYENAICYSTPIIRTDEQGLICGL